MIQLDISNLHRFLTSLQEGQNFSYEQPPAGADDIHARMEMYVQRFLQSVGSTEAAESRLEERIQAAMAARIGNTELEELVSLDADQVQLEAIGQQITSAIRTAAADEFGIEVVDVRLKRFNYPAQVKPAVYAEIRSDRARVAGVVGGAP